MKISISNLVDSVVRTKAVLKYELNDIYHFIESMHA